MQPIESVQPVKLFVPKTMNLNNHLETVERQRTESKNDQRFFENAIPSKFHIETKDKQTK